MKITNISLLKAIGIVGGIALTLPACTSGEEEIPDVDKKDRLEITAVIELQSKAAGTEPGVTASNYDKRTFAENDRITVKNNKPTSSTADYYYTGSQWLPVTGTGLTTSGNEGFTASYPISFSSILANQNSYENFWKSNKLESVATAQGNLVNFSFKPVAAKITIKVSYSSEMTGMGTTIVGNTLLNNNTGDQTITLLNATVSGKTHTYTGIINPGTHSFKISVTSKEVGGAASSTKTNSQTNVTMDAAHNYIYSFSSTNDLILTGVQVEDFKDQPEINGGSAT